MFEIVRQRVVKSVDGALAPSARKVFQLGQPFGLQRQRFLNILKVEVRRVYVNSANLGYTRAALSAASTRASLKGMRRRRTPVAS